MCLAEQFSLQDYIYIFWCIAVTYKVCEQIHAYAGILRMTVRRACSSLNPISCDLVYQRWGPKLTNLCARCRHRPDAHVLRQTKSHTHSHSFSKRTSFANRAKWYTFRVYSQGRVGSHRTIFRCEIRAFSRAVHSQSHWLQQTRETRILLETHTHFAPTGMRRGGSGRRAQGPVWPSVCCLARVGNSKRIRLAILLISVICQYFFLLWTIHIIYYTIKHFGLCTELFLIKHNKTNSSYYNFWITILFHWFISKIKIQ